MKKYLAGFLAVLMVMSFGITAFADPGAGAASPAVDDPNPGGKDLAYRGPALNQSKKTAEKTVIRLTVGGVELPITLVDITDADTLPAAEKEAFLNAFKEVRKITEKVVKYFFWLSPAGAGTPGLFDFSCEGEGVEVTMNGKAMEVESRGEHAYTATLTEYGAMAIMCNA